MIVIVIIEHDHRLKPEAPKVRSSASSSLSCYVLYSTQYSYIASEELQEGRFAPIFFTSGAGRRHIMDVPPNT